MAEGLPAQESDIWLDWVHFLRAYKVVIERISGDLAEKRLPTLIEYSVLFWLSNADNHRLRLVDLSKGVLVSKSRVTRLMQHLVDQGWVRREQAFVDKRVTYAVLTDSGARALDEATPTFTLAFNRYFASQLTGHFGELSKKLRPMATQLEPLPPPYDRYLD
jgi:DNA-binding MarR family transcriptional regulator